MGLPNKNVTCDHCGHTFVMDTKKYWCDKCGRPVFYDAKGRRGNMWTNIIVIASFAGVCCFIAYIFIEMIAEPLLK